MNRNLRLRLAILFAILSWAGIVAAATAVPERLAGQPENETGYEAWLRYERLPESPLTAEYRAALSDIAVFEDTAVMRSVIDELDRAARGMLAIRLNVSRSVTPQTRLIVGMFRELPNAMESVVPADIRAAVGPEGFLIRCSLHAGGNRIVIASNDENGVLYGVFRFIRLMQAKRAIADTPVVDNPYFPIRTVNHWDNPSGSVERGYGGRSIWKWNSDHDSAVTERYVDYCRLLASLGLNGSVINNVNTYQHGRVHGWRLITEEYATRVERIADTLSRYGIKLYLRVSFMSPVLTGDLSTADPLDADVQRWWRRKAERLAERMPNFGGFLVKADSEGEKGPKHYGRTPAEGANMLADALRPVGGVVIWRAFVYGHEELSADRSMQAYEFFKPYDGLFADNVILQIKNGPIDFQVYEPPSPLFGAMPDTNLMIELQITQEYHGQATHLNNLVGYWADILSFDTHALGPGTTISDVIRRSGSRHSGIAGVINFGDSDSWTGHHLLQANTYGFGRLAWNPETSVWEILEEWTEVTFGDDPLVLETIPKMLAEAYDIYASYHFPFGVGHMGWLTWWHYRPNPWQYPSYHRTDSAGTGYGRSITTGSGFIGQYHPAARRIFERPETTPRDKLLWFHHLPYEYEMDNGETLIQNIYDRHFEGVESVANLIGQWRSLSGRIDEQRFREVLAKLNEQLAEALVWRDIINGYYYEKSAVPDRHDRPVALRRSIPGLVREAAE